MTRRPFFKRAIVVSACFTALLLLLLLLANSVDGAFIQQQPSNKRSLFSLCAYLDDASSPVNGRQQQKQKQQPSPSQPKDYTGAGTLGDIMSKETAESGLVTTDGGLLHSKFGISSPLDRLALTANGNLQRLFSSYYDAPVHVIVDSCDLVSPPSTWNRVVHLSVHDTTFCTAKSRITVHDATCRKLVESGKVGLGQLFRHLDILPSFSLLDAGYQEEGGGMWRSYKLDCSELTCHIEETFLPNMWNIKEQDENR